MDSLRFTPSELQHWGSSLKGISELQVGSEVSGNKWELGDSFLLDRKADRGYCPFSEPSPHDAISDTPSTQLRLFAPPWRFLKILFHPTYRPTQTVNGDSSI